MVVCRAHFLIIFGALVSGVLFLSVHGFGFSQIRSTRSLVSAEAPLSGKHVSQKSKDNAAHTEIGRASNATLGVRNLPPHHLAFHVLLADVLVATV